MGFILNWVETAREEKAAQPLPQSFGPDQRWHKSENFSGYSQFHWLLTVSRGPLCLGDSGHNMLQHHSGDDSSGQAELLLPSSETLASDKKQAAEHRLVQSLKSCFIRTLPLNNTSSRGVLPAFTPASQGGMYTALQAKDYTWRSGHKTQLQERRCEATVPLCFSVDIGDHLPRLLSPCNGLGVRWCRTLLQRQSPDGCGMEKRLSCFPN